MSYRRQQGATALIILPRKNPRFYKQGILYV